MEDVTIDSTELYFDEWIERKGLKISNKKSFLRLSQKMMTSPLKSGFVTSLFPGSEASQLTECYCFTVIRSKFSRISNDENKFVRIRTTTVSKIITGDITVARTSIAMQMLVISQFSINDITVKKLVDVVFIC